jgi:hypothetical protein
MYSRMLQREEEGIEKLREVIRFATDDDCNLPKPDGRFD